MPAFDNPAFQRLAESLGAAASSARSFDLVFDDDLPVTVTLHPNGTEVGVDVWCHDAARMAGAQRRAMVKTLLMLNHSSRAGLPLCIGLDNRDFVLVHGRRGLDGLERSAFTAWLSWLLDQSRRVRSLVRTLGFEDGRLAYVLSASQQGDA